MQSHKTDIVMAADDQYAPWLGILIMSIIYESHDRQLRFHIVDGDISDINRQKIASLSQDANTEFCWYQPDNTSYQDFPLKRYGLAAYYRISLGRILPPSVSRVIYLDCDMMATRDIATLYQQDIGDHTIGAVEDISAPKTELGFGPQEYFNSGSLLINLEKWREHDIETQVFETIRQYQEKIEYPDQDALNLVFRNQWHRLPLEWNFQPGIWRRAEKKQFGQEGTTRLDYERALQQPALIHFLARRKPWIYGCIHPLKRLYLDYLRQSPWADLYPAPSSLKDRFRYYKGIDKLYKQQKRWLRMKPHLRSDPR